MALYRCASCGAMNRVADDRVRDRPVCGGCKGRLDPSGAPQAVNGAGLERAVAAAPVPILVDFWASWCGPCRTAAPVVSEIGQRNAGKLLVLKVDVDQEGETAARMRVQGIPAFVLFQGGREVARRTGLASRQDMETWIAGSTRNAA